MPTDANAIDRGMKFKFRLEIEGVPAALIQEADLGTTEVAVSEAAGAGQNFPIKQGGMLKFGEFTCKGVVPLEGPGRHVWQKLLDRVQNPKTGNGLRPSQYKIDFSLYDLTPEGDPFRPWEYHGAFVQSYNPGDRDANSDSDDMIEEIVWAYDWRELRET